MIVGISAIVRGPLFIPMILLAFIIWGVWAIFALCLPQWHISHIIHQDVKSNQSIQEELNAAGAPGADVAQTLLRHVNYRISAYLQSSYPNARWEWMAHNPARLVIQGGIGRIRLYGVEDYEYADVEVDQQGKLACSLVRRMADQQSPDGDSQSSSGITLNPRVWYEQKGRQTLEMLIADLNSRGYNHLKLNENGSICTTLDGTDEETVQSTFSSFPPKVYWPQLVKVLEQEGLAATVQADCISVAW